jgi:hypothetical protein
MISSLHSSDSVLAAGGGTRYSLHALEVARVRKISQLPFSVSVILKSTLRNVVENKATDRRIS